MPYFPPPGAPHDPLPHQPHPGSWAPRPPLPGPAWGPPVQQPGVVPLRPLLLGDLFGGALQTVRRNPGATIGLAAVVTFAFMLVPTMAAIALGAGGAMPSLDLAAEDSGDSFTIEGGFLVSLVLSSLFQLLSSLVVTGLVCRVVEAALVGEKLDAGESWRRARGRLLPLLGLTLLVGLGIMVVLALPAAIGAAVGLAVSSTPLAIALGLLGALAGFVGGVILFTRYVLLATPSLVLEGRGVFASFARAGQLSRGQFWRLFGTYLLTGLVTGIVSQVVAIPFALLGVVGTLALPDSSAVVGVLLSTNLATVLTGALVGPFTAAVLALQYYDQRFRKEGLDIQLLQQSLQSGPR